MSHKKKKRLMITKMIATRRPRGATRISYMVAAFAFPVADDDISNTFNETVRNRENGQRK